MFAYLSTYKEILVQIKLPRDPDSKSYSGSQAQPVKRADSDTLSL